MRAPWRRAVGLVALMATAWGAHLPVAAAAQRSPSASAVGAPAMKGPYARPFAHTCAGLIAADPTIRCAALRTARLGNRVVAIHRVTRRDYVALYVALRERRGWFVSAEPIESWLRVTSWMSEETATGRVTAIDARPTRMGGVPVLVVRIRIAWTRDCGDDCSDGQSSYTTVGAMVCGVGSSGPRCTEPIYRRGFRAGSLAVQVEHDALVTRGSDLEDGSVLVDFR